MTRPKILILTKKQVVDRVNRFKNLRKKLKVGSFDYFAPRAGVFPVGDEPLPNNKRLRRDLFSRDAVKKIVEKIGIVDITQS